MEDQEQSSQLNQIADILVNLQLAKDSNDSSPASDEELLLGKLPSKGTLIFKGEVDVWLVRPDSTVAQIKSCAKLRVVKFPTEQDFKNKILKLPQAFIQIDDWIYPLAPNQVTVHKSSKGYFFPDLQSEVLGDNVVRISFVKAFPEYKKLVFEQILRDIVGIREISDEPYDDSSPQDVEILPVNESEDYKELSSKVKTGLLAAAELTKEGLSYGVDTTMNLIQKGAVLIKKYAGSESDRAKIGTDIKQTLETAKQYTGIIVQISSFIIRKLIAVTAILGSSAGSYFKNKAVQQISQVTGHPTEEISVYYDSISEVAEGAAEGMSLMCKEINEAAKTIGTSLTESSVDIIDHCYGPDVAEIAESAAETIGSVAALGLQIVSTNPDKLISRTVKETYGAVISKSHGQCNSEEAVDPEP